MELVVMNSMLDSITRPNAGGPRLVSAYVGSTRSQ
jgi:hypothetical protein